MIDSFKVVDVMNDVLDCIADGDADKAVEIVSNLRAEAQAEVDEFDKWADEEAKRQEDIENGRLELEDANFSKTVGY